MSARRIAVGFHLGVRGGVGGGDHAAGRGADDELAAQQAQRCATIKLGVMKRVGDDLGGPHQTGREALLLPELEHAKHQTAHTKGQPEQADVAHKTIGTGARLDQTEESAVEPQNQRRDGPDRHQDDLAAQVVADLDLFLVLMGDPIDVVVALGLEEEMPRLTTGHRYQPCRQTRHRRIDKQQAVRSDEAQGTHQMQRLVDRAVMVEAVVVEALDAQLFEKILHRLSE